VVSAVFHMLGYNFLEVLIVLLIIDSIGFGAMIEIERSKSKKEAEASNIVTQKIEGLEKICQDVLHRVSTNPALVKLEDRLREHKEERNNMLDRMSRKTLELEQKINKFGARLAEHMEDVGSRLEKIEKPQSEDDSFSLGELVYLNEKEED
jgi:predicted transposase YdaD